MIASIKRLALAPAAAANDDAFEWRALWSVAADRVGLRLSDNIRTISDELAIDAKNGFERAFDLCRRVVMGLQSPHGRVYQFTQNGNIFGNGEAEVDVRVYHRSKAGAANWILSPSDGGGRQISNCPASWADMLKELRAASFTKGDG